MRQIIKTIDLSKKNPELYLDVVDKKTGITLLSKKSDSYVQGFIIGLWAQMTGVGTAAEGPFVSRHGTIDYNVSSVTIEDPPIVGINLNQTGLTAFRIEGVQGATELNGWWDNIEYVAAGSSTNNRRYRLLGAPEPTAAWVPDTGRIVPYKSDTETATLTQRGAAWFRTPNVRVGVDDTPVAVNDYALRGEVPAGILTGGSVTVSTPAIGANTSEITITRDFVNNSGETWDLKEVGLFLGAGSGTGTIENMLMARDIINISLPNGATLTFNYRLRTSAVSTGGILVQFNELLYRRLALSFRTVQDIDNVNRNHGGSAIDFMCGVAGGFARPAVDVTFLPQQLIGPQLGVGTDDVTQGDFALYDRIEHGYGGGELVMHGPMVENFTINAPGEAYFDVSRIFENKSGGNITVNESGLYIPTDFNISSIISGISSAVDTRAAFCIFRDRVSPAVTINNGDAIKFIYRIRAAV